MTGREHDKTLLCESLCWAVLMSKDPAFLFYSNDFYEGTRMMFPAERACYMDLLIYQHQHGYIPLDLDRVLLYCGGVDKATLEATLEAKFVKTEKGWINLRLKQICEDRADYTNLQSVNGKVGQFWKKAKRTLSIDELSELKDFVDKNFTKQEFGEFLEKNQSDPLSEIQATLQATLKGSLKHYENENENESCVLNNNYINTENKEKEKLKKEKESVKTSTAENNQQKTLIPPSRSRSPALELSLEDVSEPIKSSLLEFIEHRKTIGEPIRSQLQLNALVKRLRKLSRNHDDTAVEILESSIAGGYQGIFEIQSSGSQRASPVKPLSKTPNNDKMLELLRSDAWLQAVPDGNTEDCEDSLTSSPMNTTKPRILH